MNAMRTFEDSPATRRAGLLVVRLLAGLLAFGLILL